MSARMSVEWLAVFEVHSVDEKIVDCEQDVGLFPVAEDLHVTKEGVDVFTKLLHFIPAAGF